MHGVVLSSGARWPDADAACAGFRACAFWQCYVSIYTASVGLPLLLAPGWSVPLFGFAPAPEPWPRLVGMLLAGLSAVSLAIALSGNYGMVRVSTGVRAVFAAVLLVLALRFGPPFLYVMCAVVSLGVLGTLAALRGAVRSSRASAPRAPGRPWEEER